jgi:hypothetical protein
MFKRHKAVPVTYNPFKYAHFINAKTEAPLSAADQVLLDLKASKGKAVLAHKVAYKNERLAL